MFAEKGAMLLVGIEGNPLFPVIHGQMGMKLELLDQRCPIFESNGVNIDSDRDEVFEEEFNSLIAEAPNYYQAHYSNPPPDTISPGMGKCILEVLKSRELSTKLNAAEELNHR